MSASTLPLHEARPVSNGKIKLTGIVAHPGQEVVARLDAWIGDRYRNLDMRVGDVAVAGDVAFEIQAIAASHTQVDIVIHELQLRLIPAVLGSAFALRLGQTARLPTGQTLKLTGVGRYGLEVLFLDSDGCENFTRFDFGFWRDDGLFVEVKSSDTTTLSATLRITDEDSTNRPVVAAFGIPIALRPHDVAQFSDGTSVRFRSVQRQSYDGVDWHLLAHRKGDVSYPYAGSVPEAGEPQDETHVFGLLGLGYTLRVMGMNLSDGPCLTLVVASENPESFPLGVPFNLSLQTSQAGPNGLLVSYQGSGHGHGTEMNEWGELVPMTEAWASFQVIQDGVREEFSVDLMDFEQPAAESFFGCRFTVLSVGDHNATVQVDRAPDFDTPDEDEWVDEEPAEHPAFVQKFKKWFDRS
ncbi:MAG: hypothetical protein R3E66_04530 [bacterium]